MITLLIILAILFIIALFYRPVGRGYYSYSPAGLLLLILVVLLILYLLNVIGLFAQQEAGCRYE